MVGNTFALSKLYRKKLKEVVRYVYMPMIGDYKYMKVRKNGTIRFGKNLLHFIFTPHIELVKDILTWLKFDTPQHITTPKEQISYLYAITIAKSYNLSTATNKTSFRELLRRGAVKEPLYVDHYVNLIYGYVRDKSSAYILSIIEILNSAKNVVKDSTNRVEVIIKDAILRELSYMRAPPKRFILALNAA